MRCLLGVVLALTVGGAAQAQGLTYAPLFYDPLPSAVSGQPMKGPVDPTNTYIFATTYNDNNVANPGSYGGYGAIRIGDLIGASGGVSQTQMSNTLVGIANRIDRLQSRFSEGIALAGSINVLPPDPGDRFAVSFGGAGYDGVGAGSVSVSARVGDAIVYGALARGPTQSLVKSGVGWSFR